LSAVTAGSRTWECGAPVRWRAFRAILGEAGAVPAACVALAGSLWGIHATEADAAAGYPRTWAWLAEVGRG
jgi:hypothetical protein